MKVRNCLNPSKPCFSFEFFPPKTEPGVRELMKTLGELAPLSPGFVSVTYGAGGSTRSRTLELVKQVKREAGIETMAHLTCMGNSREEISGLLREIADAGIENVLALRGDVPMSAASDAPAPPSRDFRYASDLVSFIREQDFSFCLGSAAYPEGHMECPSRETDLLNLKTKVDAGLDFLITQLFFDNAFYFDFVERARRVGINVPIVPGIMPITSYEQLNRFVRLCGATVPMRLQVQLEQVKDNPQAIVQLGVAHATLQCAELLQRGVPGIHFYTLNRSPATRMIVSALRARFS